MVSSSKTCAEGLVGVEGCAETERLAEFEGTRTDQVKRRMANHKPDAQQQCKNTILTVGWLVTAEFGEGAGGCASK